MKNEYLAIVDQFRSRRILVLGDFLLDVYLKGSSTRLSPEAPVPVVDITDKVMLMGGAANTASNARSLGADVTFCTVLGSDWEGENAVSLMQTAGIHTGCVIRSPNRKTITKTRVMAGHHVLTRYDYGTETPLDTKEEQLLIKYLKKEYARHDALIISDYNKGTITPAVLETLLKLQHKSPKFISLDSKRIDFFRELRPSLAKPNYEEAVKLLNVPRLSSARVEQMRALGNVLLGSTAATVTVVTLDEDGSVIFENDQFVCHVPAHLVQAPNTAGAGDTFISAFTLALLAEADLRMAADLSCAAATIAIRKEATASCTLEELKAHFTMSEKVCTLQELVALCQVYRSQGKRIVFTNGCFDILHSGHVSYLNRARQLGDVLIVGINQDESIRRIKGPARPVNTLSDRMQVLSGLSAVTHIVAFGSDQDDTPAPLIAVIRPDLFVKGGDYNRDKLPEAETVEKAGGEIVFLPLVPDHSTTQIIEQIYRTSPMAVA